MHTRAILEVFPYHSARDKGGVRIILYVAQAIHAILLDPVKEGLDAGVVTLLTAHRENDRHLTDMHVRAYLSRDREGAMRYVEDDDDVADARCDGRRERG